MNAAQPERPDPEAELAQACAAVRDGDLETAAQLCRTLLDSPNLTCAYQAAMLLGDVFAGRGQFDEATRAYRRAEGMAPGVAAPDTRIACMRLRQELGTPPIPLPLPGPKIQMTSLGSNGRFGNQLLQYGFLRIYANRLGIRFEAPEWIGRYLFASDYPVPSTTLPRLEESATDLPAALRGAAPAPMNCDVWGYLCQDTGSWGPVAEDFRALFELAPALKTLFQAALDALRRRGRTLVALHIRRGDFGYGSHWVAPVSWYLDWLRSLWPQLESPVLFIATDDPRAALRFAEFSPILAADLPVQFAAAPFALDHFLLANADHLAVSNSTFSFTAALLNTTARGFVRPDPQHRSLRQFDPWRSLPLLPAGNTTDPLPGADRAIIEKWIRPGTSVVHIGPYCSAWTLEVRDAHRTLIVHEIESGESIESLLRTSGHVNHLRLDRSFALDGFFRDAYKALQHARIDMVHIAPRSDGDVAVQELQRLDYAVFDALSGQPLAPGTDAAERHILALHRRLLHLMTQSGSPDLDLAQLCRQHSIRIDTVVHVGAHEGQELPTYDALGARKVVFIEANPTVYARLEERMRARPDVQTVLRAVSDTPGTITLHLASFDQSSSVLPMGMHQTVYPGILPSGTVDVAATPLDDLLQEIGVDPRHVSMLVIDVQGAEQLVLRGASRVLDCADCVQVEISFAELYQGGAQIEDVEATLSGAGLRRAALLSGFHTTWGDAFYVRGATPPTAVHS